MYITLVVIATLYGIPPNASCLLNCTSQQIRETACPKAISVPKASGKNLATIPVLPLRGGQRTRTIYGHNVFLNQPILTIQNQSIVWTHKITSGLRDKGYPFVIQIFSDNTTYMEEKCYVPKKEYQMQHVASPSFKCSLKFVNHHQLLQLLHYISSYNLTVRVFERDHLKCINTTTPESENATSCQHWLMSPHLSNMFYLRREACLAVEDYSNNNRINRNVNITLTAIQIDTHVRFKVTGRSSNPFTDIMVHVVDNDSMDIHKTIHKLIHSNAPSGVFDTSFTNRSNPNSLYHAEIRIYCPGDTTTPAQWHYTDVVSVMQQETTVRDKRSTIQPHISTNSGLVYKTSNTSRIHITIIVGCIIVLVSSITCSFAVVFRHWRVHRSSDSARSEHRLNSVKEVFGCMYSYVKRGCFGHSERVKQNGSESKVLLNNVDQRGLGQYKLSEIVKQIGDVEHKEQLLVLYHPETSSHVDNVTNLVNVLEGHGRTVLGLQKDLIKNWRQVNDQVGTNIKDIIIVFSRGLFNLCQLYSSKSTQQESSRNEKWTNLINQRNGEYLPCLVLEKLRVLRQNENRKICVYIVLFENDSATSGILEEFTLRHLSMIQIKTFNLNNQDFLFEIKVTNL